MNLISLSTKELLRYHCCCHGNIVTIATVYVADACYPTLQLHKERLETTWLVVYYKLHIFLLQKLGQGRLNDVLTKKMLIKCFKF